MLVMTMGLLLLALPGVRVLYEHGVFPTTAVHAIVEVLRGYSGSIIPMALAPLVSALFYARRNYKVPMLVGITAAVANMILNIVGCFVCKHVAVLAYATSIASWSQLAILWYCAGKSLPMYKGLMWKTFKESGKTVVTTILAAFITIGINILTNTTYVVFIHPLANPAKPLESFLDQCEVFFAESALFLAVLFGLAKLLRAEDLLNLTSFQYWKGHQSILRN